MAGTNESKTVHKLTQKETFYSGLKRNLMQLMQLQKFHQASVKRAFQSTPGKMLVFWFGGFFEGYSKIMAKMLAICNF